MVKMSKPRIIGAWVALSILICTSVLLALRSPLLEWREPVYIVAGLAGVLALVALVLQPLFALKITAGIRARSAQTLHRANGLLLLMLVIVHVIGLWITSPPDVIDALLFRSATQFSLWGVIAMWCVFITASIALFRRKLKFRAHTWKVIHLLLALVIVMCTGVHAILIDGTMETVTKALLCLVLIVISFLAVFDYFTQAKRLRFK